MHDLPVKVRVRAAEPADAAAIDGLMLCLDELHAEARPDLFRVPSGRPRGEDFLSSVLDDPEQQILVAQRGEKVIGYVHLLIRNTAPGDHRIERRYSEIDTISVHPAEQGAGTGRMLIEAAAKWAASKGIDDHQIAVHEFNRRARALYEDLGFEPSVNVLRRKGR